MAVCPARSAAWTRGSAIASLVGRQTSILDGPGRWVGRASAGPSPERETAHSESGPLQGEERYCYVSYVGPAARPASDERSFVVLLRGPGSSPSWVSLNTRMPQGRRMLCDPGHSEAASVVFLGA